MNVLAYDPYVTQDQAAETVECPNSGAMVRPAVECAGCDQYGKCPATDGEAA